MRSRAFTVMSQDCILEQQNLRDFSQNDFSDRLFFLILLLVLYEGWEPFILLKTTDSQEKLCQGSHVWETTNTLEYHGENKLQAVNKWLKS